MPSLRTDTAAGPSPAERAATRDEAPEIERGPELTSTPPATAQEATSAASASALAPRLTQQIAEALVARCGQLAVALDGAGRIQYWSPAAQHVTGYSPYEAVGAVLWDLVLAPDEAAALGSKAAQLAPGGAPLESVNFWRARDGSRRLIHWRCLRTADGNALLAIGEDITERERAERWVASHGQIPERLIEQLPAMVWTTDRELRFTFGMGAALAQLGLHPGQLTGVPVGALFQSDEADHPYLRPMHAALAGQSTELEVELWGRTFCVHIEPLREPPGRIIGTMGVALDVTRQTEAERARARTLSLLRATLDSTADGILVVDEAGHIVSYNARFLEIWRLPDDLVAAGSDLRAIEQVASQLRDPAAFVARVRALYAAPDNEGLDLLELRDGRVLERYSRPQRIGGRTVGRVWSFRDVTEHRRFEAEREALLAQERRARAEAEEALRVREEFLSIASHELRTPLTAARLFLQVLQRACGRTAPTDALARTAAPSLRQLQAQLDRVNRLVDQLLEVSRLAQGRFTLEREPMDLAAAARTVSEAMRAEADAVGSALHVVADAEAGGHWDRSRIEQLIGHLLSNAIRYGAGRPIELAVRADDRVATLTVRDHGIGIAPEDLERIFDRFTRAVPARQYGGLGLGLFLTRQIAEAHGGTVRVESRSGAGACFTVELPRGAARAP